MNCLLSAIRVNTFDLFFFLCKLASTAGVEYLRMLFSTIVAFLHKVNIFFNCLVTFVLWFTNQNWFALRIGQRAVLLKF